MKKGLQIVLSLSLVGALMFTGCSFGGKKEVTQEMINEAKNNVKSDFDASMNGIKKGFNSAGQSVHDPSIVEVNGTYYIYGSHCSAAKSTDLNKWTNITGGAGYSPNNTIYGKIYNSEKGALAYTGSSESVFPTSNGKAIWAPDVKYSEKRKLYYMYFCTSSDYRTSTICYATGKSPEGPFEWQGNLVYSGLTSQVIDKTDVLDYVDEKWVKEHYYSDEEGYTYKNSEYPNAIDPTIFWDKDGKMWMTYGSWSGGIFLLEIDEETGKVIHPKADEANGVDPYYGKRLLGGGHTSIEGPYIVYDKDSDYYYLFVSYGALQKTGGYQMRVFRSKEVDGDYVDMKGKAPAMRSGSHSFFGLKLSGNYIMPSLEQAYMATGHNSAMIATNGKKYICYHTRFENKGEFHEPRVHQYLLSEDGWPCMLPYSTSGETAKTDGYEKEKIVGEYYLLNHGSNINADIAEPEKVVFTDNGVIVGKSKSGSWQTKDGTNYIDITYGGKTFKGVLCEMKDEAGTTCMTFSAVGENLSIWGVKY